MSLANPLWGAPRIHGELLKLGIDVGQTSVAQYMARYRRPPSQGWKTFLRNHADGIASMDLFVVPTLSFRLLYGLLILRHGRPNPMAGSDGTPERRMDCPETHRSLRLGRDAEVHRSRSRLCLRRNFHPSASCGFVARMMVVQIVSRATNIRRRAQDLDVRVPAFGSA
jgi:hypothetical protein